MTSFSQHLSQLDLLFPRLTPLIPLHSRGGGWSDFNTECWPPLSGTDYDGTVALTSAALVIPGEQAAVPFDVCLNDLFQSGGSTYDEGTGENTNRSSGTSDITVNACQQFYDKAVTIDGTGYRTKSVRT